MCLVENHPSFDLAELQQEYSFHCAPSGIMSMVVNWLYTTTDSQTYRAVYDIVVFLKFSSTRGR